MNQENQNPNRENFQVRPPKRYSEQNLTALIDLTEAAKNTSVNESQIKNDIGGIKKEVKDLIEKLKEMDEDSHSDTDSDEEELLGLVLKKEKKIIRQGLRLQRLENERARR